MMMCWTMGLFLYIYFFFHKEMPCIETAVAVMSLFPQQSTYFHSGSTEVKSVGPFSNGGNAGFRKLRSLFTFGMEINFSIRNTFRKVRIGVNGDGFYLKRDLNLIIILSSSEHTGPRVNPGVSKIEEASSIRILFPCCGCEMNKINEKFFLDPRSASEMEMYTSSIFPFKTSIFHQVSPIFLLRELVPTPNIENRRTAPPLRRTASSAGSRQKTWERWRKMVRERKRDSSDIERFGSHTTWSWTWGKEERTSGRQMLPKDSSHAR